MYIELQYQWIDILNLYLNIKQNVLKKLVDWGKKINKISRQAVSTYTFKFGKFELCYVLFINNCLLTVLGPSITSYM